MSSIGRENLVPEVTTFKKTFWTSAALQVLEDLSGPAEFILIILNKCHFVCCLHASLDITMGFP